MSVQSLATRSLTLALAAAFIAAIPPQFTHADDAAPQVDNSKVTFEGVINSNAVYVRSGPGENYYATVKLDKGATVTVVGLKFDWLKILPPPGSFSYVAKAYVEKRGDGSVGRVSKPNLNVRAGSSLNALKTTVETKLDQDAEVKILGEQDEYFKIQPPADAYLYVNKQYVDPVKPLPPASARPGPDPIASSPMVTTTPEVPAKTTAAANTAATTQPAGVAAVPTTQGSNGQAVAIAPSTQPAAPTAEAQFDSTEAAFLNATKLPLQEQPLDTLLTDYESLTKEPTLPASMRRIADMRISTLKLRADARDQYAQAVKMQQEAKAKETALKAEQQELTQRVKDQTVTIYTAVGTLRSSSLQVAGTTLYRLTDPDTGRTLVYIRGDNAKYADLLNQFVGVRGDIVEDPTMSLKTITPTLAEAVDQSKVNTTVTAQLIPPSMMPKAPTARVNLNEN